MPASFCALKSYAVLAGLLVAVPSVAAGQAADPSRPNIVVMMADDMGFSDIGCYGGEIDTPNLNSLAAGGLRFTQFYNTARCCPTRATLMSGLYAHQAGVGHMMIDDELPGYRGELSPNCLTIAQVLQTAGYRTAMSGKWHVTRQVGLWGNTELTSQHNWPRQRGFDKFFGTIHGGGSFYDPISLLRDNTPIEPDTPDFYYTTAIAENAASYIDELSQGKAPYFLYVAFTSPHWPLHAFEKDIAKYKGRYDGGWDTLRAERHARMQELGIVDDEWPLTSRDPQVKPWDETPHKEWMARRMEVYAAQIDVMDRGIGRIVEAVRRSGRADNTLILFLADNGGCAEELGPRAGGLHIPSKTRDGRPVTRGNLPELMPGPDDTYQSYGVGWANASNTPFRLYKHWVHEGGISTPLIAHWPATIKRAGQLTNEPGHLIDIMATCIDVAAADYPAEFAGQQITPPEGKSLLPVFETGRRARHEAIFWEHEGNRAVRMGRWKLVSSFPGKWELYDIDEDRTEMHDLAGEHPDRVAEMSARYRGWAARAQVVPWKEIQQSRRARRGQ